MRLAEFDRRTVESLVAEFVDLRRSTVDLLSSFREAEWAQSGISSGLPLSVRAIGYILVGHVIHHQEVLQERYLNQLEG